MLLVSRSKEDLTDDVSSVKSISTRHTVPNATNFDIASCLEKAASHNTEMSIYSQNGEDGIINFIHTCIGTPIKYFVEFGVQNGDQCNTRLLREHFGWKGLMMDGGNENVDRNLQKEFITPENIISLFSKYRVPGDFGLLSVDTDGVDFHLTDRILRAGYRPRVVVLEFNRNFAANEAYAVTDVRDRENAARDSVKNGVGWDGTCYFGMSGKAAVMLMDHFGYQFVTTDRLGINIFFVMKAISGDMPNLTLNKYGFSLQTPLHAECSDRTWLDIDQVDLSDDMWHSKAPTSMLKQHYVDGSGEMMAKFEPINSII